MKLDKIVTGGTVITPGGSQQVDIGIQGEKIAAIGTDLIAQSNGAEQIDASGHFPEDRLPRSHP